MITQRDYDRATDLLRQVLESHVHGGEADVIMAELDQALQDHRLLAQPKPESRRLPTMRVLRQLEVTPANFLALYELLATGILSRLSYDVSTDNAPHGSCMTATLMADNSRTTATAGDWLVEDEQHRWWVLSANLHRDMTRTGNIIPCDNGQNSK